jgi:hypothetical protein
LVRMLGRCPTNWAIPSVPGLFKGKKITDMIYFLKFHILYPSNLIFCSPLQEELLFLIWYFPLPFVFLYIYNISHIMYIYS